MTSLRTLLIVALALPALVGCASVETAAPQAAVRDCLESVPGAGDLHDRAPRIGTGCRQDDGTSGRKSSGTGMSTDSGGSDSGAAIAGSGSSSQPASGVPFSPAPSASARLSPSAQSAPQASLARGQKSSAGPGRYVLWIKAESHVYLVDKGVVTRVMVTTGLPWKTPAGNYKVKYKARNSSSLDEGHTWTLPYFVAFWRRPGADGDIAFHEVPHDSKGRLEQPLDTLGFPGYQSDGCDRMAPADAKAIWDFTEVGTPVVVR